MANVVYPTSYPKDASAPDQGASRGMDLDMSAQSRNYGHNSQQSIVNHKRKANTAAGGSNADLAASHPAKRQRSLNPSPVAKADNESKARNSAGNYPLSSSTFDDLPQTVGSASKDGSDTEPEELPQKSMPIFLGSGRYYVPCDRYSIEMDFAADGFSRPPLGSCVFDYKRKSHKSSRTELVMDSPDAEEIDLDDGTELEIPRAFAGVAADELPSLKWRRMWGLMTSKLIPKELRRLQTQRASQISQLKRVSFSLLKEIKRRAGKNFRGLRDANMRAKRLVRDMQMYWRKYEKEIAETRKRADKMETEKRKTDTERQERERQQRKLEFLLTQTELFSHFIGKKMGILPPGTGAPGAASQAIPPEEAKEQAAVPRQRSDGVNHEANSKEEKHKQMKMEIKQEAMAATKSLINQHYKKTAQFDKDFAAAQIQNGVRPQSVTESELAKTQIKDMDLLNPSTMPQDSMQVEEPKIFNGNLKSYQKKGLNWLANLYEQGINGILADEMGLGKTIQSIAFMAHLCETKGIWGPFLVIAPNSTLHQWQQEISKFCPTLNVLPYWGNQKERKIIRKYWKPKLLYKKNAAFHLLITSYHVVVADEKYFHRLKWQYMLLDEAQAIKNAGSLRWKSLLNLKCRNRLLLTGTPIQNSMAELWALLHFIMPDFFDSHEEFNEWFSKDIQGHAQGDRHNLDAHQLQRLHMILKPFMLRRVKKDVENEMAPKIEIQVNCPLSIRQRKLYDALKNKISMKDLLTNTESLMNIVMQFRKVCNHPEIFERRSVDQPYYFIPPQSFLHKYDFDRMHIHGESYKMGANPLSFPWPRLLDSGLRLQCLSGWGSRNKLITNTFNIFHAHYIHTSLFRNDQPTSQPKREENLLFSSRCSSSCFAFTRFIDATPAEISFIAHTNIIYSWLVSIVRQQRLETVNHGLNFAENDYKFDTGNPKPLRLGSTFRSLFLISPHRQLFSFRERIMSGPSARSIVPKDKAKATDDLYASRLPALIQSHTERLQGIVGTLTQTICCFAKAYSPPAMPLVRGMNYRNWYESVFYHPVIKRILTGSEINTTHATYVPFSLGLSIACDMLPSRSRRVSALPGKSNIGDIRLGTLSKQVGGVIGSNTSEMTIPNFGKLLSDSGKLCTLDSLLKRLRVEGHRVLIFSQMTKMIDILEDYMRFRKIKFFRLDGQTSLADRRDMVREFQTNPEYFVFLLSTRAGGLGINLTAADTVIFYDNDWNPTMDAQAMDRVHRIGQTKQVTVYRLVCKNTVEERILKRAQVKHTIQKTVYAGGFKMQAGGDNNVQEISSIFKANELRELVLGDEVKDHLLEEKRKKEVKQKQLEQERKEKKERIEKEKAEKRRIREEKEKVRQQKLAEKQQEKDRKAKERQAKKEQKEKERQEKQHQRKMAKQIKKQEKNWQQAMSAQQLAMIAMQQNVGGYQFAGFQQQQFGQQQQFRHQSQYGQQGVAPQAAPVQGDEAADRSFQYNGQIGNHQQPTGQVEAAANRMDVNTDDPNPGNSLA